MIFFSYACIQWFFPSGYSQEKQTPSYHYEVISTINPEIGSFDILPFFFLNLVEIGNLVPHLVPGYSFL